MMAAGTAAEFLLSSDANVTLLEKNEKLGKKLYITGKGRCNLTNNTDIQGLLEHTVTNPLFLQSAFHALPVPSLMNFFESLNLPLKTERGGRVFPESDKAWHVTDALSEYMKSVGVKVKLNCEVNGIEVSPGGMFELKTQSGKITATALIIATGGLSYPSTGSTGSGYRFASDLGHSVVDTYPSLVPLIVSESWAGNLEGLSLRNVRCTVREQKSILYQETGEMIFTDRGVSGPIILRASAILTKKLTEKLPLKIEIDLKPGLTHEQLDTRILRDFAESQNKDFANALNGLLPQRLINTIVALSEISPSKKVNAITRVERQALVYLLKSLHLTPTETTGYKEAVITKGGVNVKEINPSTLESKKTPGLFFAGEVIDVDALTGGYNLQIAFSTGYLAGLNAGKLTGSHDNNGTTSTH